MADQHLTRALLAALVHQDAATFHEALVRLLLHLLDLCPDCRREYDAYLGEARGEEEGRLYEEAVVEGLGKVHGREEEVRALKVEAARDFAELMKLGGARRRMRIHRALTRFRSPYLVDLLLEESARQVTADPFAALDLAESAHEVALRLPMDRCGRAWCMTAIARANAHRGNALRATVDLHTAEPLLDMAYALFAEHGNGDPLVLAELSALLGTLRKEQQRFEEAEILLDRAVELYRACGDEVLAARELITKATLLNSGRGQTQRALATVEEALALLSPEEAPRLYLCAHHNLLFYLHELGRHEEARDLLVASADLYRRFPDGWTQLRLAWLEGRIAFGLGNLEEAETTLAAVRLRFIDHGLGFDAALAGLDLALVYLETDKTQELKQLAREMVPIFMAQDIHREAIAALMLFQEAARHEVVTRSMVEELARYMQQVRRLPRERPS